MKNPAIAALLLTLASVVAVPAPAEEQGHLNVRTVVQKERIVTDHDGTARIELVAADSVAPGDDIVYTITFTNVSGKVAENIVITNPIASALSYVDGSAFGPGTEIEFSVDDGATFGRFNELVVAAGATERPAEADDVTHVRWTMKGDLPAGAEGMARFRARLN